MINWKVNEESRSILFEKVYFTALYQQCLQDIKTSIIKPFILAIIQLGWAEFLDQELKANWAQFRGPMLHCRFYIAWIKVRLPPYNSKEKFILIIELSSQQWWQLSTTNCEYTTKFFRRACMKVEHKLTCSKWDVNPWSTNELRLIPCIY
jgi:hypothetical protein